LAWLTRRCCPEMADVRLAARKSTASMESVSDE
jgi:hypothetical protein